MAEIRGSDLMRIQPVDSYHSPQIPTRDYVDDNPEILNHIPRRWMSDAVVLTALAGTVMLMSTCKNNASQRNTSVSKIAPIFNHGRGIVTEKSRPRFVPGMMPPPTFSMLGEDEAREIIRDEASKFDIHFDTSDKLQKMIKVPTVANKQKTHKKAVVQLDGRDSKRHIYFEVIAGMDPETLRDSKILLPKIDVYDTKGVANKLHKILRKESPRGIYGIFYDPIVDHSDVADSTNTPEKYWKADKQAIAKAKQLLRAQVKDFIKWLKTQGVI
jgi:hypothetical protein